jgi:Ca-activated chloride channel family protein
MAATDLAPTRLGAAVAALRVFAAGLPAETQVGLVSFSTTAQVVQQPTSDRARLAAALRTLRPEAGTALGAGLAAAVRLARRAAAPAAIVLESDGAQNRGPTRPLEAAARAKAAGIPVYGISLGTRTGAIRFGAGLSVNSIPVPPDPATVDAVSRATGGTAYSVGTRAELGAAYERLAARFR